MTEGERIFPDWENLYKDQQVESMPWYNKDLDTDLEEELDRRKISTGRILDLGTGPGTQAVKLYERGFTVIASDLSEAAIKQASTRYNKDINKVNFIVDNILNSKFNDNEFDFIFDRGCFHVISINNRLQYIQEIRRILKDEGILFLKCFSEKEPQRESGPSRFSKDMIKELFTNKGFEIQSMKETVYQGTLNPLPKALFVVMIKIGNK